MKVCLFLGPDGESVSRGEQLAGGTVSAVEPRGHAERSPSAAAHAGGPVEAVTLNGRRRAPPRDRGQGTRQLGTSEVREQRACAARAGAQLDRGPASDVRRGGRCGLAERQACSAGRHAAASWGARLALRAGVGAIFLAASLASAQNVVGPNTVDSIQIPISNYTGSMVPLQNVHVVINAPAYFVVDSSSTLTVLPGDSQNLVINFHMANVPANVSQFDVGLQVRMDSVGPDPDPTTYDTSVSFPTKSIPLLVEERDSAVFGFGPLDGPKLSEGSLTYRQAGRQALGAGIEGASRRRRLAKPSAYRPQGGKPTVCSPSRTRTYNLPLYIGGLPVGNTPECSTSGTARGRFAGFSVRPSCLKFRSLARACAQGNLLENRGGYNG